jgi:hypothetical protein
MGCDRGHQGIERSDAAAGERDRELGEGRPARAPAAQGQGRCGTGPHRVRSMQGIAVDLGRFRTPRAAIPSYLPLILDSLLLMRASEVRLVHA